MVGRDRKGEYRQGDAGAKTQAVDRCVSCSVRHEPGPSANGERCAHQLALRQHHHLHAHAWIGAPVELMEANVPTNSFPDWLEPMAATLTQERFTGPEWIFERKFDGIRLLAFKHGTDVRLFSRNRLPQNHPSIVEAIAKLPVREVILDGEVTWSRSSPAYYVFDIMWLNGRDVTSLPLDERRA